MKRIDLLRKQQTRLREDIAEMLGSNLGGTVVKTT